MILQGVQNENSIPHAVMINVLAIVHFAQYIPSLSNFAEALLQFK